MTRELLGRAKALHELVESALAWRAVDPPEAFDPPTVEWARKMAAANGKHIVDASVIRQLRIVSTELGAAINKTEAELDDPRTADGVPLGLFLAESYELVHGAVEAIEDNTYSADATRFIRRLAQRLEQLLDAVKPEGWEPILTQVDRGQERP